MMFWTVTVGKRTLATTNTERAAWAWANHWNSLNYRAFKRTGRFGRRKPAVVTEVETV